MIGYNKLGSNGRLGNQMFQYAALRGIASARGYDWVVPSPEGPHQTNYGLFDCFEMSGVGEKNLGLVPGTFPTYKANTGAFDEEFFNNCPDDCNIEDYFQTEKYFVHIKDEIKKDFQFKKEHLELCKNFMSGIGDAIFLHVRRGDYVNLQYYHPVCELEYYERALEHFDKDIPVLVFSDDSGWCSKQEIFSSDRFLLSQDNERYAHVHLDGDGQMNPKDIAKLTKAITEEKYNYAKGNRFFTIKNVKQMPAVRKFGNLVLSFMSKLSTGYYEIFDPNNGFTAIDSDYLTQLPLDEIDNRYFFESDMLYQLNLLGAKVLDIPLPAIYKDEHSSLNIWQSVIIFPKKHLINFVKRIIYTYYLRDFNIASVQLLVGSIFFWWGSVLGLTTWLHNMKNGVSSATGTIMLVGILIITGVQLLLSFLNFDMRSQKRIRF
jgi:hypothetical protein